MNNMPCFLPYFYNCCFLGSKVGDFSNYEFFGDRPLEAHFDKCFFNTKAIKTETWIVVEIHNYNPTDSPYLDFNKTTNSIENESWPRKEDEYEGCYFQDIVG